MNCPPFLFVPPLSFFLRCRANVQCLRGLMLLISQPVLLQTLDCLTSPRPGWRAKDHGDLHFDSSLLGTDKDLPVKGASCTDETSSANLKLVSLKNCRTVGSACKLIRDKAFECASRKEFVL